MQMLRRSLQVGPSSRQYIIVNAAGQPIDPSVRSLAFVTDAESNWPPKAAQKNLGQFFVLLSPINPSIHQSEVVNPTAQMPSIHQSINPSIRGSSIQPLRGHQSINPSIRQSYQSASPPTWWNVRLRSRHHGMTLYGTVVEAIAPTAKTVGAAAEPQDQGDQLHGQLARTS